MKRVFILFSFCILAFTLSAQDFAKLNDVDIKTAEECRSYDSTALQCANYILTTPNVENSDRSSAMSFLIRWMSSTPDYSFALDAGVTKYGSKKDMLLGVYMAGMVKYCMENKSKASDKNEVAINAYHTLAVYCSNDANQVKQDKDLKKLIEADNNGTLKDYLNIK